MSELFQEFDTRLKKIDRKRAHLANGYVSKVSKDGLIVFRPKRRKAGFPVRGLAFLVVGLICFKALIMSFLGDSVYGERITTLNQGSFIEQAGALVMQPDPVTSAIADKLGPFLQ